MSNNITSLTNYNSKDKTDPFFITSLLTTIGSICSITAIILYIKNTKDKKTTKQFYTKLHNETLRIRRDFESLILLIHECDSNCSNNDMIADKTTTILGTQLFFNKYQLIRYLDLNKSATNIQNRILKLEEELYNISFDIYSHTGCVPFEKDLIDKIDPLIKKLGRQECGTYMKNLKNTLEELDNRLAELSR
ncbi:MAG: hypothetical protein ACYS1A_09550 [Planctomycetota bacterium]|jgi:hypothetical protein